LSNAVTPIYEADEHMKTQLRKQIRAEAGVTMRQVQAGAKRKQKASDEPSSLIATGLAVRPPEGLDEVEAIAQAAQEAHHTVLCSTAQCRGETLSLQESNTPAKPARRVQSRNMIFDRKAK
jgi:hypothetical protein